MFDHIKNISQPSKTELETENERIFSYKMSKLINISELQLVSGGKNGNNNNNGTTKGTGRATYSQYGGQDAEADVDYDF